MSSLDEAAPNESAPTAPTVPCVAPATEPLSRVLTPAPLAPSVPLAPSPFTHLPEQQSRNQQRISRFSSSTRSNNSTPNDGLSVSVPLLPPSIEYHRGSGQFPHAPPLEHYRGGDGAPVGILGQRPPAHRRGVRFFLGLHGTIRGPTKRTYRFPIIRIAAAAVHPPCGAAAFGRQRRYGAVLFRATLSRAMVSRATRLHSSECGVWSLRGWECRWLDGAGKK